MSEIKPRLAYLAATSFGAGFSPVWPGTAGALVGVAIAAALLPLSGVATALACAALLGIGVWASAQVCRHAGTEDPQIIVIDETFGTAATLCALPLDPLWWAAGFIAFRFFDIAKPWPIRLMHDRIRGGWGVMADDGVAALYAAAVLLVLEWLVAG